MPNDFEPQTRPLKITGDYVTRCVRQAWIDQDIEMVVKTMPGMTLHQFREIGEGRAIIDGDSESGFKVVIP